MYRHCCASLTYENIKFEQLQINKNTCIHRCFLFINFQLFILGLRRSRQTDSFYNISSSQ